MGIGGKYQLVDSDRYDDFLKSVGAGMLERNQAWKFRPQMEWVPVEDGKWKQRTSACERNSEIYFVPGEEFEEEFCGKKLKSKITLEGNRLVHNQKIGPIEATVIREFKGEEMISIFKAGETTATRTFRKIA